MSKSSERRDRKIKKGSIRHWTGHWYIGVKCVDIHETLPERKRNAPLTGKNADLFFHAKMEPKEEEHPQYEYVIGPFWVRDEAKRLAIDYRIENIDTKKFVINPSEFEAIEDPLREGLISGGKYV